MKRSLSCRHRCRMIMSAPLDDHVGTASGRSELAGQLTGAIEVCALPSSHAPNRSVVVRPEAKDSGWYSASSRLKAAGLSQAIALFEQAAEVVPIPRSPVPS